MVVIVIAPSCAILPSKCTTIILITGYPALIFGGWLYETGIVLVLHIQNVRLHCCVWLGVIIGVRCGRTFEAASCNFALMRHFAFRIHYDAIMTVHWSSLVEYMMERVLCRPWTSRSYVCIVVCEWSNLMALSIGIGHSLMRYVERCCYYVLVINDVVLLLYEVVISWVAFWRHHNFNNNHTMIFVG